MHVRAYVLDEGVKMSEDDFVTIIKASVKCDSAKRIVVNFHPASVQRREDTWNGSVCANTALVVGFDDSTRKVVLEDSNFEPFYRSWAVKASTLIELMRERDGNSNRARGFLELVRGPDVTRERTSGVDLRRSMQHHPMKQHLSSVACSIALALSELAHRPYSAEDVCYAWAGFSIRTLSSQLTLEQTAAAAEQAVARDARLAQTVKVDTVRRFDWTKMPVAEYTALLTVKHAVVLLVYQPAVIFPETERGVTTLAGAIVTKVEGGRVYVVDGDLARRGRMWNKLVERTMRGTAGLLIFSRRI